MCNQQPHQFVLLVTREKRAPKLRGDGGTKPTEIDASIELYVVTLQRHEIGNGSKGQPIELWLSSDQSRPEEREIALLESEKSLEDLYHMADVHLIHINCFKALPKRVCQLDAQERLTNAPLDTVKHPSDNG